MKKILFCLASLLAVFGAKAVTYTESLQTTPPEGVEFGAVESTVDVVVNDDGTYDFTLNNWVYKQGNYPMGLGKFTLTGLTGTTTKGLTTIEGNQTVDFEEGNYPGIIYWASGTLKKIPVTVEATFSDDKMYAVIKADASGTYFNTVYNAVFGENDFPMPSPIKTVTYTESLQTTPPEGVEFGAIESTVDVVTYDDGTYDFTLNNWVYKQGNYPMGLGKFTLTGLTGTTTKGLTTIEVNQTVDFEEGNYPGIIYWASGTLKKIPVTVEATFSDDKMYAVIKADATGTYFNTVYNAVFGENSFSDDPVEKETVNFYFQDGEEDDFELDEPWKMVCMRNESVGEFGENVEISSAYLPFEFSEVTILKIYPEDLDYEITVNVENYDNDEVFNLYKEESEWYLTLFKGANDLEVYVKVYQAGQAPGNGGENNEVETWFNFSSAPGNNIEKPEDFVTITYFDKSDLTEKIVDGSVTIAPATTLTLTPTEGYMITDVYTMAAGVASISEPQEVTDPWYIYIIDEPKDNFATFFIEVAKAPASVMIDFISSSENIFGNPQDYVSVTSDSDITFADTNNKIVIPAEGLEFTLAPVDQFEISSLVINKGENVVNVEDLEEYNSSVSLTDGVYTVKLSAEANGLVFTFDIADSASSGVNTIDMFDQNDVVFNMQGIRVYNRDLKAGVYIINGKKVMIGK